MKSQFRSAHATGSWHQAVKSCVSQLGDVRGAANLGFVYVTDALADDLASILTFLRETTGVADWVGTVGIGVSATGNEYFDEPAVVVMTAALPPDSFRVFPGISADAGAFRRENGDWIESAKPKLGLVHGDPRNPRIANLVCDLADSAATFLVGGLTSSRRGFEQVAGDITQGGLSGVLFSAGIPVATGLTQGCRPIGPTHVVSAGFGNVVAELDSREALDVLAEDSGEKVSEDFAERIASVEAAFPVAASDTGDYLVRNLIGIDAERGLLVIGEKVAAGDKIMFVRRDEEAAQEDMAHMLAQLRRRTDGAPKGGVYIACVGRGPAIFPPGNREVDLIRSAFGEFPLVGFSANGEICNNRLYGYTGVLTLFL